MNKEYEHITHEFGPVYDENSKILILGSLPSVKSRQQQFYYGHPQNRFWKVLSAVLGEDIGDCIDEKKRIMLKNRIALWDVIQSCDIIGSSDSSIRNVKENDMSVILDVADIEAIFLNGTKAYELFVRYCGIVMERNAPPVIVKLPSTSPANAAWTVQRLIEAWGEGLGKYLHNYLHRI